MWHVLKSLFAEVRWPETIAAIALIIQAIILTLHWTIMKRHGEAMERQATTAELIGQALNQLGTVLADQARIMDEQFKFQRKIEEKIERERVFEVLLDLQARFVDLKTELSAGPPSGATIQDIAKQQHLEHKWDLLEASILPCNKVLITAVHLRQDERNYFMQYAQSVDAVTRRRGLNTHQMNVSALETISNNHRDFTKRLMQAAHP